MTPPETARRKNVSISHVCGYRLDAAAVQGTDEIDRVVFYARSGRGAVRAGERITQCPGCRDDFPTGMTWDDFTTGAWPGGRAF